MEEINNLKKEKCFESSMIFGISLMIFLAKLNDGHTTLYYSPKVFGENVFPAKFTLFSDNYYLTETSKKYSEFLGGKLLKINGKSVDKSINIIKPLIPIENKISLKYYFPFKLLEPNLLSYLHLSDINHIELLLDMGGRRILERFESVRNFTPFVNILEKNRSIEETLIQKDILWYKIIPEIQTLYIQYNICEKVTKLSILQLLKMLKTSAYQNVVIDLRNNTGGDSDIFDPIIRYLKERENFVKITILIGQKTYSSAIVNLMDLLKIKKSVTIGEIPHGSPTHFGDIKEVILPNTKLTVSISTKLTKSYGYKLGEIFKPKFLISTNIEDYKKGVDTQMKTFIKLLSN
ncbi:hypothetical protein GYA44_00585 [Candidatus Microgenomates bacterium]|nr:hypothetical protein [Candidatus Microgenomates bacterium]